MKKFKNETFVCLDCETTGLDLEQDRIIEVAVTKFTFDAVVEEYDSLVDPQREIPASSIAIHNITPDMVKGKLTIEHHLPKILEIMGDHIVVGHGVKFDIEMVAKAADRHRIRHKIRNNPFLDTLRMARLYGESPINSLKQLGVHFNVEPEGAHRAMGDVIVNMHVFKHLCRNYNCLEDLFDVLSRPILMKIMPLGKHKGRPLKEIPHQYLQWAAHKDYDNDLLFSIRSELKRRKSGNLFSQAGNPFNNL